MSNSDHLIKLRFADGQSVEQASVLEATGLFLNAFVEGDVILEQTYECSAECISSLEFIIRAKLRHPLGESSFEQDRAYTPLYVVFTAWYLAGANVEIEGPWADSFPGHGALDHDTSVSLLLRPIFQDEMQVSEKTVYPSVEYLAEIHLALPHGAEWNQVKENPAFQYCFPLVSQDLYAPDNLRLHHRSGLRVDLILEQGLISSHILESIQAEIEIRYTLCARKTKIARTWWDAWIDNCPSTDIAPKHLIILPDEVAIYSLSGSIERYELQNPESLHRPLEIDFGPGINPTRPIESWLKFTMPGDDKRLLEVAIACCEQAIASANAMCSNSPNISIKPPIGVTPLQQLHEAETEYLRWLEYKKSLENPPVPHDRWNDEVKRRSERELRVQIGSQWATPIAEVIEAIDIEHAESHDYRREIGRISEFFWKVEGEIGTLKYSRLFGHTFTDARVPSKAMSFLGYEFREQVIPSYMDFPDIFTLTLGKTEFWGSVRQRVLVSCSEPSLVYSL